MAFTRFQSIGKRTPAEKAGKRDRLGADYKVRARLLEIS